MNVAAMADRNAERFGEYESLIFEERRYTNVELGDMGRRFAAGLRELGVEPGDRVITMLPNCPEVGPTYMGVLRAGAVVVPVLFLLQPPEVRHIAEHSGARALVTSPEFAAAAREATEGLGVRLIVTGEASEEATGWDEVAAAEPLAEPVEREPSDPALYMYTSGTTGRPKGVVLTHGNVLAHAEMVVDGAGVDRGSDVGLGALPQAHAAGLAGLVAALQTGVSSVLLRWFTPEGFFRAVEEHGVTTTVLVPAMFRLLLDHPDAAEYDLSSLTDVTVGAAPCPPELAREFERRFGVEVREAYGLTEATAVISANRRGATKLGSAGRPLPGVEVRILGEDGEELPAGETGEIVARGPNVMPGYLGDPGATAAAVEDGWLHTGDLGHLDEDGYLHIEGRLKDLIIRGGQNVLPGDIERLLEEHPAVGEAAVVGVPDPVYGEEVAAFVVPAPGAAPEPGELLDFAAERLAKYKRPKRLELVDALPRNGIGKVLKRELRERLA